MARDLSDFMMELSIALHKHAMYPEGHPSLGPAAGNVVEKLAQLLESRSTLALGVARSQLVIEGVATDRSNPVLQDLSGRLHRHHLGAITFSRGITAEEVLDMLRLVSVEADRMEQPLGLGPPERLTAWPHVRLYPITYERLEMVDSEEPTDEEREDKSTVSRAAQLWLGLAQAAIAVEDLEAYEQETGLQATDPSTVAKAIGEHPGGTAYDQVIVGYMLQIAEELKTGGGGEAIELKKRISKMVGQLDKDALARLLDMGGDRDQRRQFLLNASEGMNVDAVLDLVTVAQETEEQGISDYFLRLLRKLAQHAEGGHGDRKSVADRSVREQIGALITGWSLTDPNPDAYSEALQRMSASAPLFSVSPERVYLPESQRLVEMALEVGTMGEPVKRAVDDLVNEGRTKWLVETIEEANVPEVTKAIWAQLSSVEKLEQLLLEEPIDVETLDTMLANLGAAAAEPMLNALVESENRQSRRTLLDRLISLGPEVGPLAAGRLSDSRWYVQRNILTILSGLQPLPEGFRAADFANHSHPRVRQEALKIMVNDPDSRERAICKALADHDERTVRMSLTSVMDNCPGSAIPLVIARATEGFSTDQRVTAIKALGATGHRSALDALLRIAEPRKKFFRTKLPPKTPEYLAALAALHNFATDVRSIRALEAAARSKDPEIAGPALGRASPSTE